MKTVSGSASLQKRSFFLASN